MPTSQNGRESTQEDLDEQEFLYALTMHIALQLRVRAESIVQHAEIHKAVSKTIIERVIGAKRYIAVIWDARTQGTHGLPCAELVVRRYALLGEDSPKYESGMLPAVLTVEELQNANAAAEEFSAWLENHNPVRADEAVRAFRDIGRRHQSVDHQIEFVFTLEHARACIAWLLLEGK